MKINFTCHLQTEVEENLPVLMPYVYNQPEESTADVKKENQELVLSDPPKFIVPLNDSTIEEGNRFIFQCKLEHGKPKPEIIWYKDGISILNNPDYLTSYDEETGQCILTIEETFAEDSARFTCKAFNTAGVAETGATLKIKGTVVIFMMKISRYFIIFGVYLILEKYFFFFFFN